MSSVIGSEVVDLYLSFSSCLKIDESVTSYPFSHMSHFLWSLQKAGFLYYSQASVRLSLLEKGFNNYNWCLSRGPCNKGEIVNTVKGACLSIN